LMMLLVAIGIGAAIAVFAVQCTNIETIEKTTYSAVPESLQRMIITTNGDISISFVDSVQNISLTVTKKAPNAGFSSNFNDYFDDSGGITFIETLQSPEGLAAIFPCFLADIEIEIPTSVISFSSLKLTTTSGDITVSSNTPSLTYSINEFNAISTDGDISVELSVQANTFSATTINGQVSVSSPLVASNQVTATSSKGDVNLQEIVLSVNGSDAHISSTTGDVTIGNVFMYSTASQLFAQTTSGTITVTATDFIGKFVVQTTLGDLDFMAYATNNVTYYVDTPQEKIGYITNWWANSIQAITPNGDITMFFK